MAACLNCGTEKESCNYCSWECGVAVAIKEGGRQHLPNGLPIRCIKADGTMLEHPHGDHPDYKFPVTVEYALQPPVLPEWDDSYGPQDHALIYRDSAVALTLYECCYALWSIHTGLVLCGNLWVRKEWRLTDESREKIANMVLPPEC